MNNLLQAIGGAMLICIPVSFVLSIFYIPEYQRKFGDMEFLDFALTFVVMYFCLLLFAAVGFAGVTGFAMLTGAFRIGFGDGLAVAMAIFSALMGIGLLVRAFYD